MHLSEIKEVLLNVPTLTEQAEIVKFVDDFTSKEQKTEEIAVATIEKIDIMKKAILAKAFCGELGTNDSNDENAVELLKRILTDNNNSETKT